MEQFSVDVGIPMNCIFPVKNYKSEISLNNDTDILLLCALKNIINFGEDYVNFRKSQSEFRQKWLKGILFENPAQQDAKISICKIN